MHRLCTCTLTFVAAQRRLARTASLQLARSPQRMNCQLPLRWRDLPLPLGGELDLENSFR